MRWGSRTTVRPVQLVARTPARPMDSAQQHSDDRRATCVTLCGAQASSWHWRPWVRRKPHPPLAWHSGLIILHPGNRRNLHKQSRLYDY